MKNSVWEQKPSQNQGRSGYLLLSWLKTSGSLAIFAAIRRASVSAIDPPQDRNNRQ